MVMLEQLVSVQRFEAFIAQPENTGRLFELVYGEIVEKMPTREHGVIAGRVITAFNNYFDDHPIGLAAVEARHRPEGDDENDRLPDVSVVLGDKPVERKGAALYLPDIVVEIQSPDDTWRKMFERAMFYLDNGTQLVILIFPRSRQVERLTVDERMVLTENDTLDCGDLLPGFTMPVKAMFRGV